MKFAFGIWVCELTLIKNNRSRIPFLIHEKAGINRLHRIFFIRDEKKYFTDYLQEEFKLISSIFRLTRSSKEEPAKPPPFVSESINVS